jgi:hypothetical protein
MTLQFGIDLNASWNVVGQGTRGSQLFCDAAKANASLYVSGVPLVDAAAGACPQYPNQSVKIASAVIGQS